MFGTTISSSCIERTLHFIFTKFPMDVRTHLKPTESPILTTLLNLDVTQCRSEIDSLNYNRSNMQISSYEPNLPKID